MYTKLIIVVVCIFIVIGFNWLSGYLINPALLGVFTPFVLIVTFILPLLITLWMIFGLTKTKNQNSKGFILCSIAAISVAFLFSPYKPTGLDGFYYRMSLIERAEFDQAAKVVKTKAMQNNGEVINYGYSNDKLSSVLKGRSLFYSLGDFPPTIAYRNGCVSLSWGSGLTGSYDVDINMEPSKKPCFKSKFSKSMELYKNVLISTRS